jgi:acetyl esterase/lipase
VHARVIAQRHGEGADEYWLFVPDDPQPEDAPLVVFLHGWGGVDPRSYGAWIAHIVRKGRIVVYPRYQVNLRTPAAEMQANAIRAVRAAVERLSSNGPVRPRGDRWAWVGHSFGGFLTANLAAAWEEEGFAPPGAVMAVQPGASLVAELGSLSSVPADTLVLVVVGADDPLVGDAMARRIHKRLGHLDPANVDFVTVRSDRHRSGVLTADHFSPLAVDQSFPPDEAYAGSSPGGLFGFFGEIEARAARYEPDALDYYGYWKLLDGLVDAAFLGMHREYALGNTPQQQFMGQHDDGAAVTPLLVRN